MTQAERKALLNKTVSEAKAEEKKAEETKAEAKAETKVEELSELPATPKDYIKPFNPRRNGWTFLTLVGDGVMEMLTTFKKAKNGDVYPEVAFEIDGAKQTAPVLLEELMLFFPDEKGWIEWRDNNRLANCSTVQQSSRVNIAELTPATI